jgi:NADPH-dependent 2,4-dienoyl-CoA reductase/sulfur reductase-like enzyme
VRETIACDAVVLGGGPAGLEAVGALNAVKKMTS